MCVSTSQPLLPFLPYYGSQVDKAGHLTLENPDNLQNILQLRKNNKARKAPVRKTPPPPEAVVRYSMRRRFNLQSDKPSKITIGLIGCISSSWLSL